MTDRFDDMAMGEGIRNFGSTRTAHSIYNDMFGKSSRVAFQRSAVVVQQKKIPDVSFYQGVIDWDVMRLKTDAVIIRAGQNEWIDSRFVFNWAEAKRVGMKRGVYWFYDGRKSPGSQADLLVSLIRGDPPELETITDWERNYGGPHEGLPNVVAMMQRVETLLPATKSMLYTGYYWFRGNSNSMTNASQYDWLKNKSLHLAWYTENASVVLIPAPWINLLYWQFGTPSSAGYGVQSLEIDMNFINMTEAEFAARYGGAEPPPPPNGGTMEDRYYRSNVSLNIRSSAENLGTINDIGDLTIGYIVHSVEEVVSSGITWKRIDKIYKGEWVIPPLPFQSASPTGQYWVAEKGLTVYMVEVANPTPNPSPAPILKHTIEVYSDGSLTVDGNIIA